VSLPMMAFWTTLDSRNRTTKSNMLSGQVAFAGKPEQDQDRGVQDGTQDLQR
jgi:hypothetical protein